MTFINLICIETDHQMTIIRAMKIQIVKTNRQSNYKILSKVNDSAKGTDLHLSFASVVRLFYSI